jgi:hypothetical protein
MNRKLTAAIGALVAAAIVGGVAYATIPGGNGVYRPACSRAPGRSG